jgi:hypothetical protein
MADRLRHTRIAWHRRFDFRRVFVPSARCVIGKTSGGPRYRDPWCRTLPTCESSCDILLQGMDNETRMRLLPAEQAIMMGGAGHPAGVLHQAGCGGDLPVAESRGCLGRGCEAGHTAVLSVHEDRDRGLAVSVRSRTPGAQAHLIAPPPSGCSLMRAGRRDHVVHACIPAVRRDTLYPFGSKLGAEDHTTRSVDHIHTHLLVRERASTRTSF